MFLSFLNSMQTKSQDAQNPGLWVNGNRMPMQEGKGNMDKEKVIDPMGTGLDGLAASTTGAAAAQRANISQQVRAGNAQLNNPARVNVENLYREDARMNPSGSPNIYNPLTNVADAEIELMAKQIARGNLSGGRAPGAMQPEPIRENTKRSMFLTHLQGMQTNNQNAQNPGLWVNGMRQPIQETSNQRRADYLLRVAGLTEPTPGTPPRSMRQRRKTNSGRGANLAFQGEDGQGIPANLLGGPTMKNNIAREMGVSDEVVYPKDLNGDGLVSKAEQELIPVDLRDGNPSANHPDDTDLNNHIKRYGLDN